MARPRVNDLDYLAARVHGRRSRVADAARLDGLCRLQKLPELNHAFFPDTEFHAVTDLQRRLVQGLVEELSGFLGHLEGPGAALLAWMLVRFQVENMKVLIRGFTNRTPLETLREQLIRLPHGLALDVQALATAESLENFVARLPMGTPRKSLREVVGLYPDQPRPFFLEAALDRGYLQELLARAERLSDEDTELIKPIVLQEVDAFHLMLVVRGRFHYGLTAEQLRPLHVRWSRIPSERFSAMLAAPDVPGAAGLAVGRALDALPTESSGTGEASTTVDPAALEILAWKRFLRLSNRAFRRSHLGLGAIIGYAGIRRVEVMNLITLSEGIRAGMAGGAIRARMLPRIPMEAAHV